MAKLLKSVFIPCHSPQFGVFREAGLWSAKITRGHRTHIWVTEHSSSSSEGTRVLNLVSNGLLSETNHLTYPTAEHFVIGSHLTIVHKSTLFEMSFYHLSRWQQRLWIMWSTDYLNNQQQRDKRASTHANLHADVVFLGKESSHPLRTHDQQ